MPLRILVTATPTLVHDTFSSVKHIARGAAVTYVPAVKGGSSSIDIALALVNENTYDILILVGNCDDVSQVQIRTFLHRRHEKHPLALSIVVLLGDQPYLESVTGEAHKHRITGQDTIFFGRPDMKWQPKLEQKLAEAMAATSTATP